MPALPKQRLKFRAVEGLMVWDHNAALAGSNRFMGRRFDPSVGEGAHGEELHVPDDSLDYADVPAMAHALAAVRAGELEAADEYTAKRAKVAWKQSAKKAPVAKDESK